MSDWEGASGTEDGRAALDDFEETVRLGEITKNFAPVASGLKSLIANPARPDLSTVRDLAKLDHAGWVTLLTDNGNQVPPGTDGADIDAQKAAYAATLKAQAERLYPTVAFVAEAARGRLIESLAVCPGAGGSVFEKLGAVDLLLTGEMRHHDVLARVRQGTHVVLCDHTNTERGFLPVLADELTSRLPGVALHVAAEDKDPLRIV